METSGLVFLCLGPDQKLNLLSSVFSCLFLPPCSDQLFHIYFWFLFLISNLFHLDLISSTSLFPLFCHPSLPSPLLLRCAISSDGGSYDSVLGSVSALPLYPTAPGSDCTSSLAVSPYRPNILVRQADRILGGLPEPLERWHSGLGIP